MKTPHIAICLPCADRPHMLMVQSLSQMMYQLGAMRAPTVQVSGSATIVTTARNNCIDAIERIEREQDIPVEWTMWIDDDMTFPPDGLLRLLRHNKDIVGATYCRRSPPYDVHGRTLSAEAMSVHHGLVEMAGMPTGFLLIRREIFKKLKRPYFRFGPVNEDLGVQPSEDYEFSRAARELGYSLWLDVDLSKQIGHVAEKVLYPEEDGWGGKENQAKIESGIIKPNPMEVNLINGRAN